MLRSFKNKEMWFLTGTRMLSGCVFEYQFLISKIIFFIKMLKYFLCFNLNVIFAQKLFDLSFKASWHVFNLIYELIVVKHDKNSHLIELSHRVHSALDLSIFRVK